MAKSEQMLSFLSFIHLFAYIYACEVEDLLRSQFYLSFNDENFTTALPHEYNAQAPFENLFYMFIRTNPEVH